MKAIKLLLIAVIIIGGIVGLLYINSDADDIKEPPNFTSKQTNDWKDSKLYNGGSWFESKYEAAKQDAARSKSIKKNNIKTEESINIDRLSELDCTLDEIAEIAEILKKEGHLNEKIDNTTAKKRIEALREAIKTLRHGFKRGDQTMHLRPSTRNLSKEQEKFIIETFSESNEAKINAVG